jgi:hypothetical protein
LEQAHVIGSTFSKFVSMIGNPSQFFGGILVHFWIGFKWVLIRPSSSCLEFYLLKYLGGFGTNYIILNFVEFKNKLAYYAYNSKFMVKLKHLWPL